MLGISTLGIGNVISEILDAVLMISDGLKIVGNAILNIAKALGIIDPDITLEELGDKALQANLSPEDYNSYSEYVKPIEDFKIDPQKSKLTTQEQKLEKATEIGLYLMAEKFPDAKLQDFVTGIQKNPEYFKDANRIESIFGMLQNDVKGFNNIAGYISGTEKNSSNLNDAISNLKNIEKNINPQLSGREIMNAIIDLRK